MKFDKGIAKKYRKSVENAFDVIVSKGNELHRDIANRILESDMLVRVRPVKEINASGVTGLIDAGETNGKVADERLGIREAFGEIYIAIAEETIETGGQRGCEGTFVHEGRHAFDFAQTISSLSDSAVNPLSVFDPTLYELELEAHRISGNYMLSIALDEYIEEGIGLMILGRKSDGGCFLSEAGINQRLSESYGLDPINNPGPRASELLGLQLP